MRFTKLHGAGNDYIVIDARQQERDWGSLSKAMCDRHLGVGADGIILVMPSQHADIRMRMFNPDGSEAEMCGNGIRCFTRYVLERRILSPTQSEVRVETGAGIRTVIPISTDGKMTRARVNMGAPRLRAEEVPVNVTPYPYQGPLASTADVVVNHPFEVGGRVLYLTCVSMGNPHAVAFLQEPVEAFPLREIGPKVEHNPLFPRRVNFEIVNVVGGQILKARVWERGAEETLACGTGACAVTVAARLQGLIGDKVDITLPGGVLMVEWDGKGDVWMEGPVEEVFEGEWRL